MGRVRIAHVISYSSQDDIFTAENMVKGLKPWLCSKSDKSGRIEATYQLVCPSYIHFIDIGNWSTYMLEIQVSRSTSRGSKYVPYLPAVTLLTLDEIKSRSRSKAASVFSEESIAKKVMEQKWDRIKIICTQPYDKSIQFGLSYFFLRTKNEPLPDFSRFLNLHLLDSDSDDDDDSEDDNADGQSPKNKSLIETNKRSVNQKKGKLKISKKKTPCKVAAADDDKLVQTPSEKIRKIRGQFQKDAAKFFEDCEDKNSNKSFKDYVDEFGKKRNSSLTTAEKRAFYKIYLKLFGEKPGESKSLVAPKKPPVYEDDLFRKDSDCPVFNMKPAEEFHEAMRGFARTRSSPLTLEQKRLFKEKYIEHHYPDYPIKRTSLTLTSPSVKKRTPKARKQTDRVKEIPCTETKKRPTQTKVGYKKPEDFIQVDGAQPSTSRGVQFVNCPICDELFHSADIANHAATCGETPRARRSTKRRSVLNEKYINCPVCGDSYAIAELSAHVDQCIDKNDDD